MRRKNTNPVVGIMTESFHTDYSKLVVEAICDSFNEKSDKLYLDKKKRRKSVIK